MLIVFPCRWIRYPSPLQMLPFLVEQILRDNCWMVMHIILSFYGLDRLELEARQSRLDVLSLTLLPSLLYVFLVLTLLYVRPIFHFSVIVMINSQSKVVLLVLPISAWDWLCASPLFGTLLAQPRYCWRMIPYQCHTFA